MNNEYPVTSLREEVLTVADLSGLLGITPQSLYTRRSRVPASLPPAIRLGRRLVWRRSTVEGWLRELERKQNGLGE